MNNELLLPYPPSTNTLYKNVRHSGRVKTDKYSAWIVNAGWAVKQSLSSHGGIVPVVGPVSVCIKVLRPDNRKRDIDNLAKAILDLLVRYEIIDDDRHIDSLSISWRREGPDGALVGVTEI